MRYPLAEGGKAPKPIDGPFPVGTQVQWRNYRQEIMEGEITDELAPAYRYDRTTKQLYARIGVRSCDGRDVVPWISYVATEELTQVPS